MSDKITTIVSLKAENIKRLRAVHITPDGAIVQIGGRNAQGKTSVLDSIEMALAGANSIPNRPVRDGEKGGSIILETEELIIKRKFKAGGGTSLEVTNKEGLKYNGPQTILDRLTSQIAFDPLAFVRADKKAQFKQLQTLLGIDTESIDREKKEVFDRRTGKNREVKDLTAVVESMPMTGPARVDMRELLDELGRAEKINNGVSDLEREAMESENRARQAHASYSSAVAEVGRLRDALILAQAKQQDASTQSDNATVAAQEAQERAARAERIDLEPIKERIAAVETTNAEAAKVEERKRKAEELKVISNEADMMTAHLQELEARRAALLTNCRMPVPGIGFEADGVTLHGMPLDQASSAEQLKLGLAVACAMNPKLRVMLIRDGSLLDADSMKMVAEIAEANEAQVWIERVGDDGHCTVVIEDGEIVSPPAGEGLTVGKSEPAAGVEKTTKAAPKPAPEPAPTPVPAADGVTLTADPQPAFRY